MSTITDMQFKIRFDLTSAITIRFEMIQPSERGRHFRYFSFHIVQEKKIKFTPLHVIDAYLHLNLSQVLLYRFF